MGHVNNAVIMEFFDLGKQEYFTAAGLPPDEGDYTVMVVRLEVDFKRQIRARDHVAVQTALDHFGTKSLTMRQQVVDCQSGDVCACCTTVMAGYRRSSRQSEPIPDTIKADILRYEDCLRKQCMASPNSLPHEE